MVSVTCQEASSWQHMKWREYRTIDDFRMVCDNPHPSYSWWTTWSRQSVVNANGRWILMCFPTLVSNHPNFFHRDFGPSVSCVNSGHRSPKHEILIAISWPFQWSYLIMCIMSMIRLFQNLGVFRDVDVWFFQFSLNPKRRDGSRKWWSAVESTDLDCLSR